MHRQDAESPGRQVTLQPGGQADAGIVHDGSGGEHS